MTPKQQRFVEEYLVDLNATQAAIRAGYSKKTANEQASRLLADVNISSAVAAKLNQRSEKVGITAERVLDEIAAMAFYDPADLTIERKDGKGAVVIGGINGPDDIKNLPETVRRAIVGWKYTEHGFEVKLADKSKALDQLARHLAIYNDKLNVNLNDGLADRVRRAKQRTGAADD